MSRNSNLLPLLFSLVFTCGLLGVGSVLVLRLLGNQNPLEQVTGRLSTSPAAKTPERLGANFSDVSNVPSGTFQYGGSTTWAPIRRDVDPLIQVAWPNFRLRYTDPATGTPGSGSGIRMLLNNQIAFAQSSRPLNEKERQQAQSQGIKLVELPVAIDGLAIAVNPTLKIPGLTVQQVVDIYTGKLRNWSQVGGPNLTITPFSRRLEDGGTVEFFVQEVLGGQQLSTNVVMVRDTTDALRRLGTTVGGIYYASAPEIVGQCSVRPLPLGRQPNQYVPPYQEPYVDSSQCPQRRNTLNYQGFQDGTYPITRRLFVITKDDNSLDAQAGRAYAALLLTDEGQAIIEKAGYVRLR
ncbi:ABC-type transport system substrate-binding component [Thermosynechococcus sp. NK55a]|uniref:PstS family phosphate ABC transporter substrate-binding protein n=1 Tax=unclassified Thermosynechococcus TaxID=2622553 RepID=UPI0003D80804|nr:MULTISPECIES: PstS family phosphate ABC transporter substrate-binding protein [unclassified Thermosynechococcus]AHB88497.1 ABC-type transport system substrate-binding component [Thermosynechococcus sp. NK55a]